MGNSNAPAGDFNPLNSQKAFRKNSDKYMRKIKRDQARVLRRDPNAETTHLQEETTRCCCYERSSSIDRHIDSTAKNEWVEFCSFNLKNLSHSDDWVSDIVRFVKRYRKDFNPRPYQSVVFKQNLYLTRRESQEDREKLLIGTVVSRQDSSRERSVSNSAISDLAR